MLLALAAGPLAVPVAGQLPPPPSPPENPLTTAKARLGRALFWDEQLSSPRTVSCGTCHIPSAGGGDPRSATSLVAVHPGADGVFGGADDVLGSPGVPRTLADGSYVGSVHFGFTEQPTGRRTISFVNAAYAPELFWDGRAASQFTDPVSSAIVIAAGGGLESQAVGPLVNDVEMGHVGRTWPDVISRVAASPPLALAAHVPALLLDWIDGRDYAALFAEAFGSPGITAPRIAMAIASFERTQFTSQTPFDAYLETGDLGVFTALESQGFDVFNSANCNTCHSGALLSDNSFRYTGVRPGADDIGREAVTGLPDDKGKMRVPSLRNVELRAPYMHNGRFGTLEDVVEFYDDGGHFVEPNLDPVIQPLNLTPQEKLALAAFLRRPLTEPRLAAEREPYDRPRLYTETTRVPVVQATGGITGSGGLVPAAVALEPPYLGNPSFTVAVHRGLGGANALLAIDGDGDPGHDAARERRFRLREPDARWHRRRPGIRLGQHGDPRPAVESRPRAVRTLLRRRSRGRRRDCRLSAVHLPDLPAAPGHDPFRRQLRDERHRRLEHPLPLKLAAPRSAARALGLLDPQAPVAALHRVLAPHTVGPPDAELKRRVRIEAAETEVGRGVVRRLEAPTAGDPPPLDSRRSFQLDDRPIGVHVRRRGDELHRQRTAGRRLVPQQNRSPIQRREDNVDVLIPVEVAEGERAAMELPAEDPAGVECSLEPGAATLVEQRLLRPRRGHRGRLHLRIDVTVRDQKVLVAVEIEIEEAAPPRQVGPAGGADAELGRTILEQATSQVEPQGVRVVGEGGREQVDRSRRVDIGERDPHRRLHHALPARRDARDGGDVGEAPAAEIAKELVGHGVVADEQVRLPVGVEVDDPRDQAIVERARREESGGLCHVTKPAAADIFVEAIR